MDRKSGPRTKKLDRFLNSLDNITYAWKTRIFYIACHHKRNFVSLSCRPIKYLHTVWSRFYDRVITVTIFFSILLLISFFLPDKETHRNAIFTLTKCSVELLRTFNGKKMYANNVISIIDLKLYPAHFRFCETATENSLLNFRSRHCNLRMT